MLTLKVYSKSATILHVYLCILDCCVRGYWTHTSGMNQLHTALQITTGQARGTMYIGPCRKTTNHLTYWVSNSTEPSQYLPICPFICLDVCFALCVFVCRANECRICGMKWFAHYQRFRISKKNEPTESGAIWIHQKLMDIGLQNNRVFFLFGYKANYN